MALIIDRNTTYRIPKNPASPIRHAWDMVKRDHEQVLGVVPKLISAEDEPADVVIRYAVPEDRCPDRPEAFCFRFVKYGGRTELHIAAGDDLGLVYGMLEYSGKHLGVMTAHDEKGGRDSRPEQDVEAKSGHHADPQGSERPSRQADRGPQGESGGGPKSEGGGARETENDKGGIRPAE